MGNTGVDQIMWDCRVLIREDCEIGIFSLSCLFICVDHGFWLVRIVSLVCSHYHVCSNEWMMDSSEVLFSFFRCGQKRYVGGICEYFL